MAAALSLDGQAGHDLIPGIEAQLGLERGGERHDLSLVDLQVGLAGEIRLGSDVCKVHVSVAGRVVLQLERQRLTHAVAPCDDYLAGLEPQWGALLDPE